MTLAHGAQFGPYEILSFLGAGGMGEVCLAQDSRLGRKVALKLLPEQFTQDQDRVRRFEQEARAASALNHPNIITIYEIGQFDGTHFIATEFVDGPTLRQLIAGGRVSLSEALDIAAQVAQGLAAAHETGIVHRDIKPENIMLRRDGYAKILDFGLAKLTEPSLARADTDAPTAGYVKTNPGTVMGTARYMSPEQARGWAVDARTDIFSLGVVIYEMVAMRPPFEGETANEVIAAILGRDPPPLGRYAREVPEALEWIVTKALAKSCEQRYQTVKDLALDLKGLKHRLEIQAELERQSGSVRPAPAVGQFRAPLADAMTLTAGEASPLLPPPSGQVHPLAGEPSALRPDERPTIAPSVRETRRQFFRSDWRRLAFGLLVVVALLAGWFAWQARRRLAPALEAASVVALPAKFYGAPDFNYLTDAIPSTLTTHLAGVQSLETKAPPTSRDVERVGGDLKRLAEVYGVNAFILSSLNAAPDRFVLNVQLVEAQSRRLMWSREYEGPREKYLELVRGATEGLRGALRPAATPLQPEAGGARNAEAELLYQRGVYYQAAYSNRKQAEDFDRALDHLKRALDLDPMQARAAAALAKLYVARIEAGVSLRETLPEIETWANRALTVDHRSGEAFQVLSFLEEVRPQGDHRKQLEYALKAATYAGYAGNSHHVLAAALARNSYVLALEAALEAGRQDPLLLNAQLFAAALLSHQGQPKEGLRLIDRVLGVEPQMPIAVIMQAYLLLRDHRPGEAEALAPRLEKMVAERRLHPGWVDFFRDWLDFEQRVKRGEPREAVLASLERLVRRARGQAPPFPRWETMTGNVLFLQARHDSTPAALETLSWRAAAGIVEAYDGLLLNPEFEALRKDAQFPNLVRNARNEFEQVLKVLDEARARGELPAYLEKPLTQVRRLSASPPS